MRRRLSPSLSRASLSPASPDASPVPRRAHGMVWDGAKLTRGSGGGKLQRRSGAESNGGDGRKPTAGRCCRRGIGRVSTKIDGEEEGEGVGMRNRDGAHRRRQIADGRIWGRRLRGGGGTRRAPTGAPSRTARAPRHGSGGMGKAAGPEDAEMMMPPPVSTHAGRLSLCPQPACAGRLLVRLLAVRPVNIIARVARTRAAAPATSS